MGDHSDSGESVLTHQAESRYPFELYADVVALLRRHGHQPPGDTELRRRAHASTAHVLAQLVGAFEGRALPDKGVDDHVLTAMIMAQADVSMLGEVLTCRGMQVG